MMQSTCAVFRARNDLAPDIRNRIHNLHFCTSDRATPALIRPFMSRLLSRQFLAATYDGDLFSATPALGMLVSHSKSSSSNFSFPINECPPSTPTRLGQWGSFICWMKQSITSHLSYWCHFQESLKIWMLRFEILTTRGSWPPPPPPPCFQDQNQEKSLENSTKCGRPSCTQDLIDRPNIILSP